MKHFVIKTFIFILPLFSLLAFLEFKLQFNSSSYYALKSNCLKNKLSQCKLIVLGSSMENTGIKPEIIDTNSINLALIGGTGIETFERLIIEYAPKCPQLNDVIIPISTFSFFANENRTELESRKVFLFKYFNIYKNEFQNPLNCLLIPQIGIKRALKQTVKSSKVKMTSSGFEINNEYDPNKLNQKEGLSSVLRNVETDINSIHDTQFNLNLNMLRNIISQLKLKGVKVHLITSPVSKYYYTNVNPEVLQLIIKTARSIADEFKIDYFNYFSDQRFVDSDFFNCDHLNHQGAIKFSKIIKRDVFDKKP